MTKAALVVINAMIALLLSTATWADVYRCIVDGKTQYTDRPCADGELIAKSQPKKPDRQPSNYAAETTARSRNDAAESRRAESEARQQDVQAAIAKRERDDLWNRRNMSVTCITEKYNLWVVQQKLRPTPDESDRKIGELRRECRDIYRIPQDL